jgi:ACR3 family arsenite transporter
MRSAKAMNKEKTQGISFFEKYLTIWVLLCMAAGILIGRFSPGIRTVLESMQIAGQNIPLTILMWLMIYPMMLRVDFKSIKNVGKNPQGVIISTLASWGIKPFLMFGLATVFFQCECQLETEPDDNLNLSHA